MEEEFVAAVSPPYPPSLREGGTTVKGSLSQKARKRVEEIFGWMKVIGGFRKPRFRGLERTQLAAYFIGAAYNLLRVARLLAA